MIGVASRAATLVAVVAAALTASAAAARTSAAAESHAAPDPTCATGVPGPEGACCLKSCGVCGGPGCGGRPGGGGGCCGGGVSNRSCSSFSPPCKMAPPPPPATKCGDYPAPLSPTLKNVLLVGDSISMPLGVSPGGYGNNVKEILTTHGGINVWHNGGWGTGGQASNTAKGLECTTSTSGNWLNFTGSYDIIHFNFGLHDLALDSEHTPIPQYGTNLATIYKRFAAKATKVIWTTTTPCPNVTTSYGRTNANVKAYNAEAIRSLTAVAGPTLIVDDLYTAVETDCGVNYKSCDLQLPANVHFTPKGCQFLGEHVSKTILSALGM